MDGPLQECRNQVWSHFLQRLPDYMAAGRPNGCQAREQLPFAQKDGQGRRYLERLPRPRCMSIRLSVLITPYVLRVSPARTTIHLTSPPTECITCVKSPWNCTICPGLTLQHRHPLVDDVRSGDDHKKSLHGEGEISATMHDGLTGWKTET